MGSLRIFKPNVLVTPENERQCISWPNGNNERSTHLGKRRFRELSERHARTDRLRRDTATDAQQGQTHISAVTNTMPTTTCAHCTTVTRNRCRCSGGVLPHNESSGVGVL